MGSRLQLQTVLENLAGGADDPEKKIEVNFQPDVNIEMGYPCIVYMRDRARTQFADNSPYRYTKRYQVTVIDRDPDSPIPNLVAALPMCLHERTFTVDNLYHDVFNVYF